MNDWELSHSDDHRGRRACCGELGKAAFYRQMAQADSRYTDEVQPLYPKITTLTLILLRRREDS